MKAVLLMGHGGPEMLRYGDVPDPVAGPGDVVVDIHAASVNARRLQGARRQQHLQPGEVSPHSGPRFLRPCLRGGAGVTDFAIGDAVFGV